MVNNDTSASVTRGNLSDGEMLAVLNLAGIQTSKISPLAQLKGQPVTLDTKKLQSAGLTDGAGRPTATFREALAILANPASEIDMLWGNPEGISLSKVYSAAGQDKMVAFTGIDGSNNVSFPLSSQDITDLLVQKLVFNEIKNNVSLDAELPPSALPVFFAVLDAYRENQLKAALDRRQEPPVNVNAEDLNRIVQEAKTETNFSWYTPVAYFVMPPGQPVTEASVAEGLKALQNESLVSAGGDLSSALTSFAPRAFPIAGFFGLKIITVNGGAAEKTQLALFRGISTLLLAEMTEENGREKVEIRSISTSQLPELLFNLGTRALEAPPPPAQPAPSAQAAPPATIKCGKCGTQNDAKSKFCSKCGAALAAAQAQAGPKFCPKCGDPVTAGEKFCDKCGAALK